MAFETHNESTAALGLGDLGGVNVQADLTTHAAQSYHS